MSARNLENHLIQLLNSNAAVVLTAPRQVGKTTLALSLQDSQSSVYGDLENPRELAQLRDALNIEQRFVVFHSKAWHRKLAE